MNTINKEGINIFTYIMYGHPDEWPPKPMFLVEHWKDIPRYEPWRSLKERCSDKSNILRNEE